jgi:aminomethyltransferase
MNKIGVDFPKTPRKTVLNDAEEWYQKLLSEKLNKPYEPIQRNNFGEYDMAVHYLTSILEEAASINKVSVFNIDHMAQIEFTGKDAANLLDRVLPANIKNMKTGQCKYTLLLNENATVRDDLIVMKLSDEKFILVINAGHDITDEEKGKLSDGDFIFQYKKEDEDVYAKDISDELVKIDIQGPLSYKLIKEIYGESVLKNRNNPKKNMRFFTFNEFDYENHHFIISRTGYTNRWGWELYVPVAIGVREFKKIVTKALDLGGLLVGLGGRDENRISAGTFGLPLMGNEYDHDHDPVNAPLFNAAVDMTKEFFISKKALEDIIATNPQKRLVVIISEGLVVGRKVFLNGKKIGTVTSSIISPNVSLEKRLFIGSKRKNVNDENGTAAIGLAWLSINPFEQDSEGNDILEKDGKPIRIKVEFYRTDENDVPKGRPTLGYISGDGVNPATAHKPLKNIQNL